MIGLPGAGKPCWPRLPTIMPLTLREALETTKIHSVAGRIAHDTSLMTRRPFEALITISDVALVGEVPICSPANLLHNNECSSSMSCLSSNVPF